MAVSSIKAQDNIGLVYACAKRFLNRGLEYDDIVQAGCIGLMKAAKSFDKNRGIQFSTYAVPVILGEIKQLFRSSGTIKVSRGLKDLSIKINREIESFENEYGRKPSINELSERLCVDNEQIFDALESSKQPVSLTMSNDDEDMQTDIPVEFDDEKISTHISLTNALNELEKKDKYLIILRFFESKTQSDTAKVLGVTQVWVSRREKVILKILREKLT